MALFNPEYYWALLIAMAVMSLPVFVGLQWINAGYGVMYTPKWGPAISNRIGWVLMELPALLCFLAVWLVALSHGFQAASRPWPIIIGSLFALHYLQRSLIFPLLMRGRSKMPLAIIAMGILFNSINAYLISGWLFVIAPEGYYHNWGCKPAFWIGLAIFIAGMAINLHSDNIIRHLRRPGDQRHYIPRGGMFRYVTSANYFGEFTEWVGFAILSWSWAGAVFALWTFANLAPRAAQLHRRYVAKFGDEYRQLHLRYIIPFIY